LITAERLQGYIGETKLVIKKEGGDPRQHELVIKKGGESHATRQGRNRGNSQQVIKQNIKHDNIFDMQL
jgi:hypothetical protein